MNRRKDLFICSLLTLAVFASMRGCTTADGCMGGDDGRCVPRSPCEALAYTCSAPELSIRRLTGSVANDRSEGLDALAAAGDYVLENDRARLVIDAIDAPHYLAPTGGTLLDLVPRGGARPSRSDDELNQIFQATGILPGDAVRATRIEIDDHSPAYVAAIVRGTLEGRPRTTVVTRYEMRPCEPGVRVRTELFHGGREPETFFLSDAHYFGGRESIPFIPSPGRGFLHPDLDLAELGKSFTDSAFMAVRPEREGASTYAEVACSTNGLSGFHSTSISAVGAPRAIVMPGDSLAFERFVLVADGPGVSRAVDLALEVREKLRGERTSEIRGRVVHTDGSPVTPAEHPSLLLYAPGGGALGDAPSERTPWTEIVPELDGSFRARVPAQSAIGSTQTPLRLEVHVLGRPLRDVITISGSGDRTLPDIVVPEVGRLEVRLVDGTGKPVLGEVILTPTLDSLVATTRGSTHGVFDEKQCSPWLGPAHGGSPACNRALVEQDGTTRLVVPEGRYFVYGTRGPFATLARTEVEIVRGATAQRTLVVEDLPDLLPPGVLSADFHVHAGASFDSSLPERDRARSFVATGVDVVAATDHDVITTYEKAIAALGIGSRIRVLSGAETTGHILFYRPPGADIPKVVGHYNFWPLRSDTSLPRNGLPWDELLEPGALFDKVSPAFVGRGVIQMNHPFAGSSFGRDEGFLTTIEYDVRKAVPSTPSEVGPGQLVRPSPSGRTALDYHVQEVMNGTATHQQSDYRLAWFSFLNQGIVRGGTANSDSHTLAAEVLGYPRNLVFGGHSLASFDTERFDTDVRDGHMVGTNGPVIVATLADQGPGLAPFHPRENALLKLDVRAAPWIQVDEIRFVVNGRTVKTIGAATLRKPASPFGGEGLVRFQGTVPLAELLAAVPADKDAWLVVEAGLPLVVARDLDLDGRPETTDNNHDGVIDDRDRVGREDDDFWEEPGRPSVDDPRFSAHIVAPGHWSTAFTNPWLIDRKGDGWTAPGL